ncbi:MAG: glycosyltransferase family 2 protein [Acetobacteraceae bacterium]|jgi:hypothetical protein
MDKKKLAVCAVFENEAAYLPEWLAYHRLVGVDHFMLYDNGSTDDPARAIRTSPVAGHVTLIHWPQRPGRAAAHRHFIDIFSPGYEWVAFIDLDEFLLPLNSRNVVDTLEWLGSAAGVLVHRRVFGPGASQQPPGGLVIETYDRRAADDYPANRHVRTIARCSELLDVTPNPSEFRINGPVFNTAGFLAPNSAVQAQPCYQNLVINHYYTRSRQDWLAKLQRNNETADATTPKDAPELFDRLAEVCQVRDATIQSFAAAVRDLLGLGAAAAPPPDGSGARPAVPEPSAMTAGPAGPASLAAASTAAQMPRATEAPGARPEPAPPPRETVPALPDAAPGWVARGKDAQERAGGLGLVFRDRSRPGEHWLAALRGAAVAAIDPAFLLDEFDRIRDFPSDAAARAACDEALGQATRN